MRGYLVKNIILAYVPVLHRGYRDFFRKHSFENSILYIFGQELIQEFDHLSRKDIRALSPLEIKDAIQGWGIFSKVNIADFKTLNRIQSNRATVIMPDEDETREIAEKYLNECIIEFDSVFLRWDKSKLLAKNKVESDRIISFDGFVGEMLILAAEQARKASNWWRKIGGVIARDKEILLVGYNRQVPFPIIPYVEGDARSFFKKGLHIELTTDMHAEARMIAEAANKGISLEGADLYITTFPCPPCAKLVAYSGIKRCYFNAGYAMLDGERVLRNQGVEIIFVE